MKRKNEIKFNKFISVNNEGIVEQVVYVPASGVPAGAYNLFRIGKDIKVRVGDKAIIQDDGNIIIEEKKIIEKKRAWWKLG